MKGKGSGAYGPFYLKLALSNIKKNGNIYVPYLLAGVLLSGLYYVVLAVGDMVTDSDMTGMAEMAILLFICAVLCLFIIYPVLFYINSFLMKRRKRELGLYCILGMEKRHLCLLLFWEVVCLAAASLAGGVLFGSLFSQLMFLVLLKLLHIPARLTLQFPLSALGQTALVFAAGYAATLFYDWITIWKTKPAELLKSRAEGEREPKTKGFLAFIGVVALVSGYVIALLAKNPSEGLACFFPAAALVIVGTYCLFMAGSIALLKFLRKRKKFYYRPENFIAVSGMLYRMKQNAVGLATIAILSTALLVVLSSSVTLYAGEEEMVRKMFPKEYVLELSHIAEDSASYEQELNGQLEAAAKAGGVTITGQYAYHMFWWNAKRSDNRMENEGNGGSSFIALEFMTLEDYNRVTGEEKSLSGEEVLLYSAFEQDWESISVAGCDFSIKENIGWPGGLYNETMNLDSISYSLVVVKDWQTLRMLQARCTGRCDLSYYCLFDAEGEEEAIEAFQNAAFSLPGQVKFQSRSFFRETFYVLYGSILFIGLLFVALFLIITVLIIYYKQVTEGYDDRERFGILKKVGMRDGEIRATINKQVRLVFFLPLVTAIVHICVAARVLRMFLALLGLSNRSLFWLCIAVCCIVYALVYFVVYRLTSRVYYGIVSGNGRAR